MSGQLREGEATARALLRRSPQNQLLWSSLILVLAAWTFLLVRMIRNDGSGRSTPTHQPPRSHEPDPFEKHYV